MTDRLDHLDRDEIAALLGMRDIPPLVEGRRRHTTAHTPQPRVDAGTRFCVLAVVLEDTDQAMRRLRPMVSRVEGIAFDLTALEGARRASEVAAHA
jgi:hypothetical protein